MRECEGSFTGYYFSSKKIHAFNDDDPTCGGCTRNEICGTFLKVYFTRWAAT